MKTGDLVVNIKTGTLGIVLGESPVDLEKRDQRITVQFEGRSVPGFPEIANLVVINYTGAPR